MNRFTAFSLHIVVVAAALASSAAFAQAAADTQAQPAGKTRAEVVAETRAAIQRGEVQVGHEWGYDFPVVAPRNVQLAKTAAKTTTQE